MRIHLKTTAAEVKPQPEHLAVWDELCAAIKNKGMAKALSSLKVKLSSPDYDPKSADLRNSKVEWKVPKIGTFGVRFHRLAINTKGTILSCDGYVYGYGDNPDNKFHVVGIKLKARRLPLLAPKMDAAYLRVLDFAKARIDQKQRT